MVSGKQAAPPRIVFNDQAAVFLGGVEVQTHYLGRGHTNGDAVVCFRDLRRSHWRSRRVGQAHGWQRAEELVKSGVRRTEFMPKLKTDDLNWPFPKERIDPLYDELAATGK